MWYDCQWDNEIQTYCSEFLKTTTDRRIHSFGKGGPLADTYSYISGSEFWKGGPANTFSLAWKTSAKKSFVHFLNGAWAHFGPLGSTPEQIKGTKHNLVLKQVNRFLITRHITSIPCNKAILNENYIIFNWVEENAARCKFQLVHCTFTVVFELNYEKIKQRFAD